MAEERQRLRAEAYNISSNYNSFLLSGGKKSLLFFESNIFASFQDTFIVTGPSPSLFPLLLEIVELFSRKNRCKELL